MPSFLRSLGVALACWAVPGLATAELFRCMGQDGRVSYSLERPAGPCYARIGSRAGGSRPAPASPANFPRVDSDTQKARDIDRRRILENELNEESRLLADAQRSGAPERVAIHGRNIAQLQKEISFIR